MIGIENYQELVEMINLNEFKESLVMAREDLVKSERNEMARCRGVRENEVNKSTVNSLIRRRLQSQQTNNGATSVPETFYTKIPRYLLGNT